MASTTTAWPCSAMRAGTSPCPIRSRTRPRWHARWPASTPCWCARRPRCRPRPWPRRQHLRVIGRAGAGVDTIDVEAATARGIAVMNAPDGNTLAAAEHAISLLFALARHIPRADAGMKAGQWPKAGLTGFELEGKRLGVIGLGRIGGTVARKAQGIGMEVAAYDPFLPAAAAGQGQRAAEVARRTAGLGRHRHPAYPAHQGDHQPAVGSADARDEEGRLPHQRRARRTGRRGRAAAAARRRPPGRRRARHLRHRTAAGRFAAARAPAS